MLFFLVVTALILRGVLAKKFLRLVGSENVEKFQLVTYGRYRFKRIRKFMDENYREDNSLLYHRLFIELIRPVYIFLFFLLVSILFFAITCVIG